jgi:hypothetical protein
MAGRGGEKKMKSSRGLDSPLFARMRQAVRDNESLRGDPVLGHTTQQREGPQDGHDLGTGLQPQRGRKPDSFQQKRGDTSAQAIATTSTALTKAQLRTLFPESHDDCDVDEDSEDSPSPSTQVQAEVQQGSSLIDKHEMDMDITSLGQQQEQRGGDGFDEDGFDDDFVEEGDQDKLEERVLGQWVDNPKLAGKMTSARRVRFAKKLRLIKTKGLKEETLDELMGLDDLSDVDTVPDEPLEAALAMADLDPRDGAQEMPSPLGAPATRRPPMMELMPEPNAPVDMTPDTVEVTEELMETPRMHVEAEELMETPRVHVEAEEKHAEMPKLRRSQRIKTAARRKKEQGSSTSSSTPPTVTRSAPPNAQDGEVKEDAWHQMLREEEERFARWRQEADQEQERALKRRWQADQDGLTQDQTVIVDRINTSLGGSQGIWRSKKRKQNGSKAEKRNPARTHVQTGSTLHTLGEKTQYMRYLATIKKQEPLKCQTDKRVVPTTQELSLFRSGVGVGVRTAKMGSALQQWRGNQSVLRSTKLRQRMEAIEASVRRKNGPPSCRKSKGRNKLGKTPKARYSRSVGNTGR